MMKYSKAIVALIVGLNVAFAAAVLYVCSKGQTVPDSLINAWFAFTCTELWLLAGIRKQKLKEKEVIKNDEAS